MPDLTVVTARNVAADIKLFELSGAPLGNCEAGAHIDVEVPLPSGTEQRQYSLLNTGAGLDRYQIAVLNEPNGRGGSRYMHDTVRDGDVLRCSDPKNHFPLRADAGGHLLIAGGIGVTPILAMVRSLAQGTAAFQLFYSARSHVKMAFRDEIAELCSERATFYVDGGELARGIPLNRIIDELADDWHIYVCGPKGLIEATRSAAAQRKVSDERVHSESFTAAVTVAGDKAFRVTARDSGVTVEVRSDETLLEALLRAGVDAPFDCKRGECGTCCIGVIAGEIDHRDYYLNAKERASNKLICPCVSKPKNGDLILDI